ncbi:hypothetical protein CSC82_20085 [Rhodobacteraceae bacterium 4F10]|nr:hypothetical protein CSC82_20085 [Rhodobacteraceae bacterium 4F10]
MSAFSPAMITAKALGAMPAFALSELGQRKTLRIMSGAGLVEKFVSEREGFIPEFALCEFVAGVSRELGEDNLGLLFSPFLTVADYGAWGDYVLSAPDLGTALKRAQQEMRLHSCTDRVQFVTFNNLASYSYAFGLKAHPTYPNMAFSAVAAMLSIPKHFLGKDWAPLKIEFDFPAGNRETAAEDTFGCPVLFGGSKLRLLFDKTVLHAPNPDPNVIQKTTRNDILRERSALPTNFPNSARSVVELHLAAQDVSLERLAQSMGIGPRGVQRQLSRHGTGFRQILNESRMKRAQDLLGMKGSTVASVSEALGYEEPGNFSRAFARYFGVSPTKFASAASPHSILNLDRPSK